MYLCKNLENTSNLEFPPSPISLYPVVSRKGSKFDYYKLI